MTVTHSHSHSANTGPAPWQPSSRTWRAPQFVNREAAPSEGEGGSSSRADAVKLGLDFGWRAELGEPVEWHWEGAG